MISIRRTLVSVFIIFLFMLPNFATAQDLEPGLYARMDTSKGEILLVLHYKQVPMTVMNFAGLAEGKIKSGQGESKKFYDGLTFHRVIKGFMIQGGDPKGDGTGGPGYQFPDEFVEELRHDAAGILSMANSGPNTNGSQFFITHNPTPWLDNKHTVFGKVVQGQGVVSKIEKGDRIRSIQILRKGEEAEAFKTDQQAFDAHLEKIRLEKEAQREKLKAEFLAERKKALVKFETEMLLIYPEAKTVEPGLMMVQVQEGSGPVAGDGATVMAHVTNYLVNGKVVSTTKEEGPEALVTGKDNFYTQTLGQMKKGEKQRILISYTLLGHGEKGTFGIPPKSDMVVELELLEIK